MIELVHGGDIYSDNQEEFTDFSANINPLGLPNGVKKAIVDNIDSYANYPDPLCRELRTAICGYYYDIKQLHFNIDNIVCGNGAADIIFRLVLNRKPQKAMVLSPTFAEYESALKLVGCEVQYHKLCEEDGFYLDDSILGSLDNSLDMLFVCNPNNPTGIPAKSELIIKIADKCKDNNILLVVDECFCEFLDNEWEHSIIDRIYEYKNIVVLKAFTKMYAMAGIRLGYMMCSDIELNSAIMNTLQPWSVSTVASKCGIAALKEKKYVQKTKQLIHCNREYLKNELSKLSIKVFDSAANYVFFKSEEKELVSKLKQKKILIRSCSNYVGLDGDYYRIAVKSEEDNNALLDELKDIL